MGLDSVELIINVENSFKIQIPDEKAAKIRTVNELFETVFDLIKDKNDENCLYQIIFFRVRKTLISLSPDIIISPNSKISDIIPKNKIKQTSELLSNDLNLLIPKIETGWFGRFENVFYSSTLAEVIDKIVLNNYDKLTDEFGLSKATIKNIVYGLVEDKSGINRTKIKPDSKLVNDLGLD